MLGFLLERIDQSWSPLFQRHESQIAEIIHRISDQSIAPVKDKIFRVFENPISHYRVVIVGQDPYPTPGFATGLAFSVDPNILKIPASLRNIFSEYCSDTGYDLPKNGDLAQWSQNGVLLLNSSLSLNLTNKSEHLKIGWQSFTSAVLSEINRSQTVAILWGTHAQRAGAMFPVKRKIVSAHPSPLSAYRGFFGSKPFSRTNQLLKNQNLPPINWKLS